RPVRDGADVVGDDGGESEEGRRGREDAGDRDEGARACARVRPDRGPDAVETRIPHAQRSDHESTRPGGLSGAGAGVPGREAPSARTDSHLSYARTIRATSSWRTTSRSSKSTNPMPGTPERICRASTSPLRSLPVRSICVMSPVTNAGSP